MLWAWKCSWCWTFFNSWSSIDLGIAFLILIYQLDAHAIINGNEHAQERWKKHFAFKYESSLHLPLLSCAANLSRLFVRSTSVDVFFRILLTKSWKSRIFSSTNLTTGTFMTIQYSHTINLPSLSYAANLSRLSVRSTSGDLFFKIPFTKSCEKPGFFCSTLLNAALKVWAAGRSECWSWLKE